MAQRPVPRRQAVERKTPDRGITNPRMNSYEGVYSASFRLPPFTLDKLLAQKGWGLPEEMLNMAACRSAFNLKRYAILADGWEIVPAITDPFDTRHAQATEYADYIRWMLNNIVSVEGLEQDFRQVIFEQLRGCWDGFRVAEQGLRFLEDGPYAGDLGFAGFYAKPAKQIGFDLDPRTMQVRHITSYTPGGNVGPSGQTIAQGGYDFDVPIECCVLYTYNGDAGLPHGMGDWRGCYRHWWALDNIHRFWIKALERWGGPVIIANGPAGDLKTVAAVLDNIRDGGSAALPDSVKAQLVQAATGVFDGYRLAAMWHEQQIAKNVQHNTLSSGEGQRVGSMALGEVHQDTGETVYDFIRRDVEGVFNHQVIARLCRLNLPNFDMSLCPRLQLGRADPGDVYNRMQAIALAIDKGVVWNRAPFLREMLGWKPMDPDEEKHLDMQAKAQQEAQQQLADAKLSNKAPQAMSDRDTAIALDNLARAIYATMDAKQERIAA